MMKTMHLTMNPWKNLRWLYEQKLKERRDRWAEDEYVKDIGRAEGIVVGKAEDILWLLSRYDKVPADFREIILQQKDAEILGEWLFLATKVDSIQDFRDNIDVEFTDLSEKHDYELKKELLGNEVFGNGNCIFDDGTVDEIGKIEFLIAEVQEVIEIMKAISLRKKTQRLLKQSLEERRKRWAEDERLKNISRVEGINIGRREDILQLLGRFGVVPADLQDQILQQKDTDVLGEWLLIAADAASIQDFRDKTGM